MIRKVGRGKYSEVFEGINVVNDQVVPAIAPSAATPEITSATSQSSVSPTLLIVTLLPFVFVSALSPFLLDFFLCCPLFSCLHFFMPPCVSPPLRSTVPYIIPSPLCNPSPSYSLPCVCVCVNIVSPFSLYSSQRCVIKILKPVKKKKIRREIKVSSRPAFKLFSKTK